jgi:hypothetical protein
MKAEGTYPSKVFVLLVVVSVWGGNQVCAVSESNMVSFEKLPYTFDFDGPPYPEPNLVFDGPFPKVPEKMIVYKVKDPNVTEGSMRRLAEEYFDMPVDANITRSRRMGLYWLKSGNTLVEVDRATGSFNIRRIVTESSEGMMSRDYPTKMECSNLARSYLETRKLLPESAYLRGIADNTKSSWGAVSVAFGRKIEQYNCWGAGGEILVEIGPGGECLPCGSHGRNLFLISYFQRKHRRKR